MSQLKLEEFSNTLKRIGEQQEREFQSYLTRSRAEMPAAVAHLSSRTPEQLIELLVSFTGGRSDPRETELRQEFFDHVKGEIIRRMVSK